MARRTKSTLTKADFNKLSKEQQIQEIKKMSKRANVRLALQEKKGVYNETYKQAQFFNETKGREKNRFYEGTQYKTKKELQETFSYLNRYLKDNKSTLGGVKEQVKATVDKHLKEGTLEYKTFRYMTPQERVYASQYMATLSNKRLKTLEKEKMTQYAYQHADVFNQQEGRKNNRYYRGAKFEKREDLTRHLQNEIFFLNSKSSTPQGIREIYDKRINTFRARGINIPQGQEKEFFDFLSSKQFENLGKYASSEQIVQTFVDARNANIDIEKMNREFTEFMNNETMTFDQVQERLNVARWQKKLFK